MFILVPSLYRSIALRFKIDKYLDKIIEKTDISLDPLRVLGQELCQKNDHFLLGHLKKLIFWNFLTPMLGTPYQFIFNDSCSPIFLELFKGANSNGDYLLSIVFPYLVLFHSSRFNVHIYFKHNPFGTIRSISRSDPYYNMLFEYCNDSYDPIYYIKAKLKKIVIYLLLFLTNQFKINFQFFCWLK